MTHTPDCCTQTPNRALHGASAGQWAFGDSLYLALAGTLCAALLLLSGAGYRLARSHLQRADTPALPAGTLAQLPFHLGEWRGRDVPLQESVVQAADVDDHISRIYNHSGQTTSLNVFIALGRRARDLMPHRPEVCYTGAGFTLRGRVPEKRVLPDGSALEATIYTFGRGDFGGSPLVVLNFFIVDGEVCRDVSLLRSRAWRGQSVIRYMVQVQLVAAADSEDNSVTVLAAMKSFTDRLVPPLRRLLTEVGAVTAEPQP